jgi:hypothetical protein
MRAITKKTAAGAGATGDGGNGCGKRSSRRAAVHTTAEQSRSIRGRSSTLVDAQRRIHFPCRCQETSMQTIMDDALLKSDNALLE